MLKINKDSKVAPVGKFNDSIEYMPKSGMLGTQRVGSDRYTVICVSVDSPKRITVALLYDLDNINDIKSNKDIWVDEEGIMYMNGDDYKKYRPEISKWSLRKDRKWQEMKSRYRSTIQWGIARPFQDLGF